MTGYTKLFGSIIASTIWRADNETRIVWITMLALANKSGIVEASLPGLADLARLPVDRTRIAVANLEGPDPDSRSKEHQGRRIVPVDGGWWLVNHAKYRAKMNIEERREYLRLKQAESRAKRKASTDVNKGQQESTGSTHAESSPSPEAIRSSRKGFRKPTLDEVKFACEKAGLPITEGARFWDYYESNGWRVGKNPMRSWTSALANWKRNFDTQRYANSQTNRRSNPRNDGIAIGPTDYGEAAKRKLERQALEARNREASEAQGA